MLRRILIAFAPLLWLGRAVASVSVPDLFSDHAVLQRTAQTPVWGTASPQEQIEVSIAGIVSKTQADERGKWRVSLNLASADPGPHELVMKGQNTLTIRDVAIGEVWLCSGQSNMEFPLRRSDQADREVPNSSNVFLREFRGERKATSQPEEELRGKWIVSDPATAGEFSAVAYYFGKMLQLELSAPVGLINCSWGGTPIEAWMSEMALDQNAALKKGKDREKLMIDGYARAREEFVTALTAWLKETGRDDPGCAEPADFAGDTIPEGEWTSVRWPGAIAGANLPARGVVWLRKEVNLSASALVGADPVTLELQDIRGFDTAYVNGREVGATSLADWEGEGSTRSYAVPKDVLKEGRNVVALRIFAPIGAPALGGYSDRLRLGPSSLDGAWLAKREYDLPVTPAGPKMLKLPPEACNRATYLFNGMIDPIVPYAIKGVIWYQGEANTGQAFLYRTAFPLLIKNWRAAWESANLPFYYCQLANFLPKENTPRESSWAELREAQSLALQMPHTGQAVLIDSGEAGDVHPRNKRIVGERLGMIALAQSYGQSRISSAPVYDTMSLEEGKVRLRFKPSEDHLMAKELGSAYDVKTLAKQTAPLVRNSPDSELEGFAICGSDRKWVWAEAKVDGNSVLVWSPQVHEPVAVRYGWANNPTCNLIGRSGLPVSPFRTDDFPAITNKSP